MKINLAKDSPSFRPMNLRIQDPSLFDLGEIKEYFFSFHGQIELAMAVLTEWDNEGKQTGQALGEPASDNGIKWKQKQVKKQPHLHPLKVGNGHWALRETRRLNSL